VRDAQPAPKDWLTGKPLTYDLTHSDEVFFFDRKGRERYLLEGAAHVAGGAPLPQTLRTFLDASVRANLNHPGSEAWMLPQEMRVISWLAGRRSDAAAS
jgi:protein SCO1/2